MFKESVQTLGGIIVEDVLSPSELEICRKRMYPVRERFIAEVGSEKIRAAREFGTARLIQKFDPYFFSIFENRHLLSIIDETVSSTAILHLQTSSILPSFAPDTWPDTSQNSFHHDFKRYFNGYLASIVVVLAVSDFTRENGCTLLVPGTHQRTAPPSIEYMRLNAVPAECPAGSAIVMDSTLWHSVGKNISGKDRLSLNHIFTRSFFQATIRPCPRLRRGSDKNASPSHATAARLLHTHPYLA